MSDPMCNSVYYGSSFGVGFVFGVIIIAFFTYK